VSLRTSQVQGHDQAKKGRDERTASYRC
jgi:hypothetical protein